MKITFNNIQGILVDINAGCECKIIIYIGTVGQNKLEGLSLKRYFSLVYLWAKPSSCPRGQAHAALSERYRPCRQALDQPENLAEDKRRSLFCAAEIFCEEPDR